MGMHDDFLSILNLAVGRAGSIRGLADATGCDPSAITRWRSGARSPNIDSVQLFLDYLGMDWQRALAAARGEEREDAPGNRDGGTAASRADGGIPKWDHGRAAGSRPDAGEEESGPSASRSEESGESGHPEDGDERAALRGRVEELEERLRTLQSYRIRWEGLMDYLRDAGNAAEGDAPPDRRTP